MANKATLVTGLFKSRMAAEAAVDALLKRGYTRDEISVFDKPFIKSKELLKNYVIVKTESIDDTDRMARDYIAAVDAGEVDVLELEMQNMTSQDRKSVV